MNKTRLFNVLTSGGSVHPYGMISSLEIEDRFPGAQSVKVTDSLFLVDTQDGVRIYDAESDSCRAPHDYQATGKLDGFITEISMAPDVIFPASFSEAKAVLGTEEFSISAGEVTEKMILIMFEEGDVILADISRFLLYGYVGGEFVCGYIEV